MSIYTFEFTEHELSRVTDYLHTVDALDFPQRILHIQQRLHDDLVFVAIDCTAESATWIWLIQDCHGRA
jgi:hypothetical protein